MAQLRWLTKFFSLWTFSLVHIRCEGARSTHGDTRWIDRGLRTCVQLLMRWASAIAQEGALVALLGVRLVVGFIDWLTSTGEAGVLPLQ